MQWSVRSDQNGSALAHYGVPGMKWGVRHDEKPKGIKRSKISSKVKPTLTRSNAVSNDDIRIDAGGFVFVEGLKGSVRASFKNKDTYDRFVSGKLTVDELKNINSGKKTRDLSIKAESKKKSNNTEENDSVYYCSIGGNALSGDIDLEFKTEEELRKFFEELQEQYGDMMREALKAEEEIAQRESYERKENAKKVVPSMSSEEMTAVYAMIAEATGSNDIESAKRWVENYIK